jgi:hypothetical protein
MCNALVTHLKKGMTKTAAASTREAAAILMNKLFTNYNKNVLKVCSPLNL